MLRVPGPWQAQQRDLAVELLELGLDLFDALYAVLGGQ